MTEQTAARSKGEQTMDYGDAVQYLSPCGLDCGRCADYERGEIRRTSETLLALLKNYERLAKLKAQRNPAFEHYAQFTEVLKAFSQAACSGCRGEHVLCPLDTCRAKDCQKEKQIDFCFQCGEYPCDKQFFGPLKDRWIRVNDRMREIGPAAYYLEQLEKPRY